MDTSGARRSVPPTKAQTESHQKGNAYSSEIIRRSFLFCIGILVIFLTIIGGFGKECRTPEEFCVSIEGPLRYFFNLGATELRANQIFILERWALLALLGTCVFTFTAYIFVISDLLDILEEKAEINKELALKNELPIKEFPWTKLVLFIFCTVFMPMILAAGYLGFLYVQQLGFHREAASINLKYGTGLLLLLYVVTFVVIYLLRTYTSAGLTESGRRIYKEAKFLFFRLDLPLFASFLCLFVFTSGVLGAGGEVSQPLVSAQMVNAFAAGASAFKLLVASMFYVLYTVSPEG